jgi:nicotinamidase-related amidase
MRGPISWQQQRPGRYTIRQWEIEGRATALLLLDLQLGHVDPEQGVGPRLWARFEQQARYYYNRLHQVVLPAVQELQTFFRQHALPIVYANSGLALPAGRDVAAWSWRAAATSPYGTGIPLLLDPGASEREPYPALAPRPDELLLVKQTLSPFNSTALDQYLRNMGVENLVLGGVLTSGAVDTTARTAADRGYNVIVVDEACAALSPEDHRDGTAHASWFVVKSSASLLQELAPLVRLSTEVS